MQVSTALSGGPDRVASSRLLNFALVGEHRSGSAAIASALVASQHAVCHLNLLHHKRSVRRACHEAYFGATECGDGDDLPEWFGDDTNAHQYLAHRVWDRPCHNERAIGVRLSYARVAALQLYDLFDDRCREGDFCLVHVLRNPLACLISLEQAKRSKVWGRHPNARPNRVPLPVSLEPEAVTRFVRRHADTRAKVRESCGDRCEVRYTDLLLDFAKTMRGVYDFLELGDVRPASPGFVRLRNKPFYSRVVNLGSLRNQVPTDVRDVIDSLDDEEMT